MTQMRKLEEQVGAWPHVSVHPHRFGGREFRFGNAELGHVHTGGTVDILIPPRRSRCAPGGRACGRAPLGPQFRVDYVSGPERRRPQACSVAHALVTFALCAQDGQRRSRNAGARERRAWPESPSPVPAPTAPAHTARTHYH